MNKMSNSTLSNNWHPSSYPYPEVSKENPVSFALYNWKLLFSIGLLGFFDSKSIIDLVKSKLNDFLINNGHNVILNDIMTEISDEISRILSSGQTLISWNFEISELTLAYE